MTDKHWTVIGASYAIFAIAIATLATHQTSHTSITGQPTVVAQATESPVWRSQRLDLDDSNPRRNFYLTIWVTKSCYGCEQQKAEVPALQEAGYNVVLRKGPPGRWIKSFPHIVINRDRLNGERVTELAGFHTLAEIDEILKIGETEESEEEEDLDYDIFHPWGGNFWKAEWYKIAVTYPMTKPQVSEIERLREMGFEVVVADVQEDMPSWPTAVLIDKRDNTCIHAWFTSFTAEDVLEQVRPEHLYSQVGPMNLVVWLSDNEESNRQYDEIAKLRKLGFSANVYVVGGPKRPPRHIVNFPTVILIDNSHRGGIYVWPHFVSATTIQHTANKRT